MKVRMKEEQVILIDIPSINTLPRPLHIQIIEQPFVPTYDKYAVILPVIPIKSIA